MTGKFKRGLAGVLALMLSASSANLSVLYVSATDFIEEITAETGSGDINGDGCVDSADIEMIKEFIGSKAGSISSSGYSSYDVYRDDIIDVRDIMSVKQLADGKTPEKPENESSGKTVKLEVTDADCCPGEQVTVDVNIVDWNQDINAVELYLDFDSNLSLADISCTGDYQYAIEGNELKIFGLSTLKNVYRGTVATLTFDVPDNAYGDYDVKIKDCAFYNDSFQTFSPTTEVGLIAADVTERPLYLTPSYVNSNSLRLSWSMPYCSGALEGYIIYRDGVEIARTSESWYYDEGLVNGTKYTYAVQAYGADNYLSAKSKTITSMPQNPSISAITFPDNASVIGGKSTYVKCSLEKTVDVSEYSLSYTDLQGERQTIFTGNNLAFSTVDIKWNIKDIPSGDYELTFSVTDRDGQTTEKTVPVTVDTTPPEPIFGFEVFEGEEKMQLTWGVATEAKVTGYNIYRRTESGNYTLLAYVDGRETLEYMDENLVEGDIYFYMMCAVDKFGQEGIYSEEKSAAVKGDETPPDITLFLPESGNVLNHYVTISLKADDNIGVASIAALISTDDGKTWEELFKGKGSSVNFRFDTTAYPNDKIKIKALAYDYAGNESNSLVHIYAIDNIGPAKVEEIQSVAVTGVTATISWKDVPDDDFSYFTVKYRETSDDNATEKTVNVSKTLGVNLTGLTPDTEYTVSVAAVDIYGNMGEYSEPFVFTTASDITAPAIISIKPSPAYFNSVIPLSVTARDDFSADSVTIQTSLSCEADAEWKEVALINNSGKSPEFTASYNLDLTSYSDGTIYVRAFAKDSAGNVGEASAVYEYIIDKTPPEAPTEFNVSSDASTILLQWKAYENNIDSASFSLYRSNEKNGNYVKILDKTTLLNYYDRTAEPEKEYFYKLTAIDAAGNESDMSEPVSATLAEDTEAPEIISVSPSDGGMISNVYKTVSVLASDNLKLSSITMEYRLSESEKYKVFSKIEGIGEYYTVAEGNLPVAALIGENIHIRISAVDEAGNLSEAKELTYKVNNLTTTINEIKAEQLEEYISVKWNTEENDYSTGYYLYKKVNTGNWQRIGSIPAHTAGEDGYSFTDYETTTAGNVIYKVEAYSSNGLKTEKQSNAIQIYTNPSVSLDFENVQGQGVEYIFDATGCTDYYGITNITIDFGDGTTQNSTSSVDAKFVHKYNETGEYNIKLTCENEQGLTSVIEDTVNVITRELIGEATINVRTTDGNSASGITVYLDLGEENQKKIKTDNSGRAKFKVAAGIHKIGVYGEGFLPCEKECTILAGNNNIFDFTAVKEDIVTADFTAKRMTLDEIKAAGIDITSPENQHISKVEITVDYKTDDTLSANLSYYINSNGGVVGGGSWYWSGGLGNSWGGNGGGGTGYRSKPVYIKVDPETNEVDTAIILTVPVTASWLKEFFNVKLTIYNNADKQFTISNNTVNLNCPEGLTVMDTAVSESANVKFGTLEGQSSQEINWILRGDNEGSYTVSADYYGVLDRFNEVINETFTAEEPITVYGQTAVSVDVNVPSSMYYNEFQFEVAMTNTSPADVYGASVDVGSVISSAFGAKGGGTPQIYQQRIMKDGKCVKILNTSDSLEVLEPGYTYSVIYRVPDLFKSDDDESDYMFSKLDVIKSSVKAMEGSSIPVKLNVVSPLDIIVINELPEGGGTGNGSSSAGDGTGNSGNGTSSSGDNNSDDKPAEQVGDIPDWADGKFKPEYLPTEITFGNDAKIKIDGDEDNIFNGMELSIKNLMLNFKNYEITPDGHVFMYCNMGAVTKVEGNSVSLDDTTADKIKKLREEINKFSGKKELSGDQGKASEKKNKEKKGSLGVSFEAKAYMHAYLGSLKDLDISDEESVKNALSQLKWDGYLGISATAKAKVTTQFFIGTIPFLFELGAEATVGSSASVNLRYPGEINGKLDLSLAMKVFAYFAVGTKVLSAGIYGDGTIKTSVHLIPKEDFGYDKVTGQLSLSAKVVAGPFELKSPSLKTPEIIIYDPDKNNIQSNSIENKQASLISMYSQIYDTSNYTAIQRTYMDSQIQKSDSESDDSVIMKLNTLVDNSNYNTSQNVVSNGTDTVMVFLADDKTRNTYNASCLMYSLYDSENEKWSEPVKVDSNNTFDSSPNLYTDGTDIYLIYQDTAKAFADDDEITLDDWTAVQNIAVSKFNHETGAFEEPVLLTTDSDIYDSQPVISSANGKISAVWVSNKDTNIFGMNNTNSIMYSSLEENNWSTPVVLTENLSAVTELSAGEFNDKFFVAFTEDIDNDFTTKDGKRLCAVDMNKKVYLVKEGDVSGIKFRILPEDGKEYLFFYQDGEILYTENLTVCNGLTDFTPDGITSEFDLIGDKLLWIEADSENSSNIYGCKYDSESGKWGNPIAYSNQDKYIENPAVTNCNGTIIMLANCNSVEVLADEDEISTVSSLVWGKVTDIDNIILDDVYYDRCDSVKGGNLPLTLTVTNSGNNTVNGFVAEITDIDGNTVFTKSFDKSIASGETIETEVLIEIDDNFSYGIYTVKIHSDSVNDMCESDNIIEIDMNFTDMAVSAEKSPDGMINVSVYNCGTVDSSGTLVVKDNSGNIVMSENIDKIVKGETLNKTINLRALKDVSYGEITVELLNNDDYYETDNSAAITITAEDGYMLGDANFDGRIDAIDASMVLADYAAISSNSEPVLTDEQRKSSDVNSDGLIDSVDASAILRYYAEISSGEMPSFN